MSVRRHFKDDPFSILVITSTTSNLLFSRTLQKILASLSELPSLQGFDRDNTMKQRELDALLKLLCLQSCVQHALLEP